VRGNRRLWKPRARLAQSRPGEEDVDGREGPAEGEAREEGAAGRERGKKVTRMKCVRDMLGYDHGRSPTHS